MTTAICAYWLIGLLYPTAERGRFFTRVDALKNIQYIGVKGVAMSAFLCEVHVRKKSLKRRNHADLFTDSTLNTVLYWPSRLK